MLNHLSKENIFARLRFGLIVVGILFSAQAFSASSYLDPARIDYTRPDATKQLELIDCFKNGNCVQDDKIRIYPMPCNGSGSEDCTGCYAMRGSSPVRIGDLNPTTGTCAGVGSDSDQKIRVFVGYERKCPGGSASCTGDGQLFLSCSMTTEGTAGVVDSGFVYNKECFSGTPYVRQVKESAVIATVIPSFTPLGSAGCDAGAMGVYPSCVSCSDTSYKPTIGNGTCTECIPPNIVNSINVSYSTAGTSKTSVNDCLVSFSCTSPFVPNRVAKTCDIPPTPSSTPVFTPTVSPTPSPSSTPETAFTLPSTTPPSAYCAAAMATFSLQIVSTLPHPQPDRWYVKIKFAWDKTLFGSRDFAVINFISRLPEVDARRNDFHWGEMLFDTSRTYTTPTFSPVYPSEYYYYIGGFTRNGIYCPANTPIIVTIPLP